MVVRGSGCYGVVAIEWLLWCGCYGEVVNVWFLQGNGGNVSVLSGCCGGSEFRILVGLMYGEYAIKEELSGGGVVDARNN